MNYQNIDKEIKKYTDFFKYSQSTLSKLSNYYKEVGKTGGKFADKMKKLLDEFYIDLMKEDRSNTFNKLLINFYNEKNSFINRIRAYFLLIEKNYGERLSDFEKDHQNKIKEALLKLSRMNTSLIECKTSVDKWKNQYFDMCKSIIDISNKINNSKNSSQENNQENTDTINKLNVQLTKFTGLKELKKKNYKEEEVKLNKLLEANESYYSNVINSIEKEYVNKINFVHQILKEVNTSSTNFVNEFTESMKKIESFRKELNASRDARNFKIDFDFHVKNSKNEKRFTPEEFLDYDFSLYDNDNANQINNNLLNNKQSKDSDADPAYNRARLILDLGEVKFVDLFYLSKKTKEINEIIEKLLNNEEKIEDKDYLEIINYIENNGKHSDIFMELLVTHFSKKEFVILKNIDNFHILNNILGIILNYCFDKREVFDVCFLVIFVAEKCIIFTGKDDSKIKLSMFKSLSKQQVFSSVNFWRDLINKRIDMVSMVDLKKEISKRRNSINDKSKKMYEKLFGKMSDNKIIEKTIMQRDIIKEKSTYYFTIVFYYFLKHFSNFNFTKAEELLDLFKEKYNLDEDTINFFKNIIKSDNIYFKQKEENGIDKIKKERKLFDYKPYKQFKNIEDKSIKSILFSLKYLDKSQYISILCLNKKYHKDILKLIYKHLLLNNDKIVDVKKHLEIWKILLNYNDIKKNYDYNKIKESIKDPNKIIECSDIIELDIKRTHFSKDKEAKMEKIKNILKAVASELPKLNYFQGMNQISAFLLNICDDNEEEAFYIFMSFLKNTNYTSLFTNELAKMNCIFYQFDRLLNLYLPELYLYFKASSVNSGYYISPWLITLFTNTFNDGDNDNNAKTIMLIWDLFIFLGWKSVIKIGIILLKKNEKSIMERLSEHLLPILTSEIPKSEILSSQNFEELFANCFTNEFRISNELLENTYKEYEFKKKIPYFAQETYLNTY